MTAAVESSASAPAPDVFDEWVSPVLAEFVGAFTLTFAGVSAIVITQGKDLVAIALAHGLAIGLMVAATGHISGGLFNPAVAVGLWIGRVLSTQKAIAFIIVELAGAVVAALVVKAIFPSAWTDPVKLGVPAVGGGSGALPAFNAGRAFLAEIVASFFLMYVIYGVAVDKRGPATIAGLCIGLIITMDIFAIGGVSGAAMNPSRHFGVALVGNYWDNWWIWYVGPVVGTVIAAVVYSYIYMAKTHRT